MSLNNNHLNRFSCLLCQKAEQEITIPVFSNADGSLLEEYMLGVCTHCGTGYTVPQPLPTEIKKYYEQGIYQESGGRLRSIIDTLLSLFADQRLAEIPQKYSGDKLLDVGCGKGRFLARAARQGWQVQGTDVAAGQLLAVANRYKIDVFHGEIWEAQFPAGNFDVVTAWHVLEHLYDPNKVMAEIARVLKKDGLIFLEVPNFASWQAKIGRGNWFQLDVPRHLIHYTPIGLTHLLHKHGFEVTEVRTFAPELGIYGMLQSLLNRIGMPPNSLFRWLKRSGSFSPMVIIGNFLLGLALFLPSVALELIASLNNVGGIIRIMAVKK